MNLPIPLKRKIRSIKYALMVKKYELRKDKIRKKVFSKQRINVVFFAVNVGMWKSDGLFRLLLKDERYNPVIVSFLLNHNTKKYWREIQDEMRSFFCQKEYPYYDSYDFRTGEWFDLQKLNPDIIIYAQQGNYNSSIKNYSITSLWNKALFAYVPYCLPIENIPEFYSGLLVNIAWKVFVPTDLDKLIYKKYTLTNEDNKIVVGCTFSDDISEVVEDYPWKLKDRNIKRIIWAPHHSILPSDELNYSNFLEMADPMLLLAKQYKGKAQFVFKPHPRLIDKLYKLKEWGIERTNNYFNAWAQGENTMFENGSYAALFKSSDAMIHDCSTFTGEYLFTGNPVLYLAKEDHVDYMNEFGLLCFNQHYKGRTIEEVDRFIKEVVINSKDPMKKQREEFYNQYLLPPNNRSVAENMYAEFVNPI